MNVVKRVSGDGSGVLVPFAEMLLLIATSIAKQVVPKRMARFGRVFIRVTPNRRRCIRYPSIPEHLKFSNEDDNSVDTSKPSADQANSTPEK